MDFYRSSVVKLPNFNLNTSRLEKSPVSPIASTSRNDAIIISNMLSKPKIIVPKEDMVPEEEEKEKPKREVTRKWIHSFA